MRRLTSESWFPGRSRFKSKLLALAALGVSLPVVTTCIVLGLQLDRQARSVFASGLLANLETFSLLIEGLQRNTLDGVRRTAADNTVQVTVELGIDSQLADYLEQQAGVIGLEFMIAFNRNGQSIAVGGNPPHRDRRWRLAALGAPQSPCTVKEGIELQLTACDDTTYLVSVAPVLRNRSLLGASSPKEVSWLGFLAGGVPVAAPALLDDLDRHQLGLSVVWADERLVHAGGVVANVPDLRTDATVEEYEVDGIPYLGASKAMPVGSGKLQIGLLTPLEPLVDAIMTSVGTVAVIGALAVTLSLLFIGILAGRLLRPINELGIGASKIGQGDFTHRITVTSGDEFEALAVQFNEMSARLNALYGQLESSVAERTLELSESLNQQTATAEVLKAISRSAFDLSGVLDTLIRTSVKLTGASRGTVWLRTDDRFTVAALVGVTDPLDLASWTLNESTEIRVFSIERTAALHGDVVNVADVKEDPAFRDLSGVGMLAHRTFLAVPIKRAGRAEGVISISRAVPEPFTTRQIELVKTFADQAVIALENARLLEEVKARSRELAQSRLRRFLAPQVAELLLSSGDTDTRLEIHRCEVTVVFCDLRGFTAFAEGAEPEEVMKVLGEYHSTLGEIIFRFSGTLERFVGDGLLVVFNDPIPVPEHTRKAVEMAISMREQMENLASHWSRYGHSLGFGIGIAQGFATVGPIGFDQRLDYSVIGSIPNLASRLCDHAEPGQILVSQRVSLAIEGLARLRHIGDLTFKGFQKPMPTYEVTEWGGEAIA